jgi:lipopolysaccharide/colanic/teichoic acid biosynthesis glycosyltransferase
MIRLFRVFVPASTIGLLAFETLIILGSFIASTYLFLDLDPTDYLLNGGGFLSIVLVSMSVLLGLYVQDLYSEIRMKSKLLLAQQLLMAAGLVFIVEALMNAIAPDLYLPLQVMGAGCVAAIAAIYIGRILFSTYVFPRVAAERLLLIGESPVFHDITTFIGQHPELGIEVAGQITDPNPPPPPHTLEESIRSYQSNRIVVAAPNAKLAGELLELRFLGYSIQEAVGTYAKISNRESLTGLTRERLLYTKEFEPSARYLFFWSISNTLIGGICLIVMGLPMLLIALMLRIFTTGPVIERRIRQGREGEPFTQYSFCVSEADLSWPSFAHRLLSRTGLYAFPQFWNVLRGEMSIVGPPPHAPEFAAAVAEYIPFYPHRLKVAPGMTGWSQIQMRHYAVPRDAAVELEYDLYYIKFATQTMNVFIIVQSIKNLLLWGGNPSAGFAPHVMRS